MIWHLNDPRKKELYLIGVYDTITKKKITQKQPRISNSGVVFSVWLYYLFADGYDFYYWLLRNTGKSIGAHQHARTSLTSFFFALNLRRTEAWTMVKRNVEARQNAEDIFSNFALERQEKKSSREYTPVS